MPAAVAVPLITTAVSGAIALKGQADAKKAAAAANTAATNGGVNIPQVAQQAQDQALKNIQLSQQVEQQYAPQNAALRTQSVQDLLAHLNDNPNSGIQEQLMNRLNQGGSTYGGSIADRLAYSQGAAPVTAGNASSGLLNDAVSQARSDLALGGQLPQDVRNLVARTAAGRAYGSTGNLGVGRDINARDLGLTSLQLAQQRLTNAQSLGQADLGANQFNTQLGLNAAMNNAQMFQNNNQFNTGQQNGALQFDSGQRQQANQYDSGQGLNIAQLLMNLNSNNYNQRLATAQFGQSIAAPTVGLDPSAIANLSVGNSNTQANAAQNAASIAANRAQGLTQLGGQLAGYGLSAFNRANPPATTNYNTYNTPSYVNPTMASSQGVPSSQITSSYGFGP